MHLDDELVERLRHGELEPDAERSAREHLVSCRDCRERAAEAARDEAEIHGLLRAVDHPVPRLTPGQVAARAGPDGIVWVRRAAAVLLALAAAGAAYAAPGSPLPGWVRAAVSRVLDRRMPAPPVSAPAPIPEVAGIAVDPGRSLVIGFSSRQTRGQVRVTLDDGADVRVRAPAGAARFTTEADRLVIQNAGSAADFELEIPRSAPRVEIRVAGTRVFLKLGPRVTVDGQAAGPSPFVLLLSPGP